MTGRAIAGLVGAVGALWLGVAGGWAVHWWDTRPAGEPAWANVRVLWFHWSAPDSLGARLAALQAAARVAAARARAVATAQAEVSRHASRHEEAAQAAILVRTRTILREVPTHVTAQIDRVFPLSVGFVRVHDAAAGGVDVSAVPLAASQSDDAASGVPASQAVAAIAANYGDCRADAEQLTALQAWIKAQQAALR